MKRSQDEELNLDHLLKRTKKLPPELKIDIYFDPATLFFHIQFKGIMPFWIPRGATFLFSCSAGQTRLGVETFISQAIFKFGKGIQV